MKHKLYEHIRLGAMLRPQITGTFFEHGGSCGNGAALDSIGLGGEDSPECYNLLGENFPFSNATVDGPFHMEGLPVWNVVENLNDCHGWTREQIADWLEPIEEAWWAEQEAQTIEAPEAIHA